MTRFLDYTSIVFALYLGIIGSVLLHTSTTIAAPLPQAEQPYPFVGKSTDLREVLELFGENIGIPVRLSEKIKGKIDSNFTAPDRQSFLNKLGARHGFVWFYDGGILHVSSIYDIQTRFFSLVQWSSYEMKHELSKLGIWDSRFVSMPESGANTLIVTGPEIYTNLVDMAVKEITKSQPKSIRIIVGIKKLGNSGGMNSMDPNIKATESFADEYAVEGMINQPMIAADTPPAIGAGSMPVIGDGV